MYCITINTDASFCPQTKLASWACWIVGDNLQVKASGIFASECRNPTEAEIKAICNAIAVLLKTDHNFSKVRHVIFNRDNIHAVPKRRGKPAEIKLYKLAAKLRKKCSSPVLAFRHVKAHTDTQDSRSHVNRWCDTQAKQQLQKARQLKNAAAL